MNARILVVALLSLSACYRTKNLAAPPAPAHQLPAVPLSGAPGQGLSRVVLDVEDGPAVVEELHGGSLSGSAGAHMFGGSLQVAQRVCVTPCVFDTTPGGHELRFTLAGDDTRTSVGFVNADQRVSAYRHALGTDRNKAWKGFVGWPLLVTGALLDIGMVSAFADGREIDGGMVAGAAFSVGLTVLGGWLVHGSVIEKQPGNGTQWYPE